MTKTTPTQTTQHHICRRHHPQPPQLYLDARASNEMIHGVPYIELSSRALVPLRGHGRDASRLSFVYLVGPGEETSPGARLTLADNTTVSLNGATIRDASTDLDADLSATPLFGQRMGVSGPSGETHTRTRIRVSQPCGLVSQPLRFPSRPCSSPPFQVLSFYPILPNPRSLPS